MKKLIVLLAIPAALSAQTPAAPAKEGDNLPAEAVKVESGSPKEQAKERIEGYRQRVLKGESMGTLASMYSDDPGSASKGGRYPQVGRGMMVPEFEEVAFSLQPGEVSQVFETKFGYHFIQLLARNGEMVDLRHILIIPK